MALGLRALFHIYTSHGIQSDYSYSSEEILTTTDYSFSLIENDPDCVLTPSPIPADQVVRQGITCLTIDCTVVTVIVLNESGDILASFFEI